MTFVRTHALANGQTWQTVSDGPGFSDAHIMVPVKDLQSMDPEEIGRAILSLVDEAEATELLSWMAFADRSIFVISNSEDPKAKFGKMVSRIGSETRHATLLREKFAAMERLKSLDDDLDAVYQEYAGLLDGAYAYLQRKRKLTPVQARAKQLILEMRYGCAVCGALHGQHTGSCLAVSSRLAR